MIQCKSERGIGSGVGSSTELEWVRRVSFSSDSASVTSVVPIHTRSDLSFNSDSTSIASVASVNQP